MNTPQRQDHWQGVYQTKKEQEVSWFQQTPEISLDLIRATGVQNSASVIDIGGGASRLVDELIDEGFANVSVLDLSEKALKTSQIRLGSRAANVDWIVADVTAWEPSKTYDVWHDRAAFHFLTEPDDQSAYAKCVLKAVKKGGNVIIGTFALDGPEKCSGLPIVQHNEVSLGQMLGNAFALIESRKHDHETPGGMVQKFQFSRFQRKID